MSPMTPIDPSTLTSTSPHPALIPFSNLSKCSISHFSTMNRHISAWPLTAKGPRTAEKQVSPTGWGGSLLYLNRSSILQVPPDRAAVAAEGAGFPTCQERRGPSHPPFTAMPPGTRTGCMPSEKLTSGAASAGPQQELPSGHLVSARFPVPQKDCAGQESPEGWVLWSNMASVEKLFQIAFMLHDNE